MGCRSRLEEGGCCFLMRRSTRVWPNGKTLRVNVRTEGRFGVDDGERQILEGFSKPGSTCELAAEIGEREVVAYARQRDESWQELARLPRGEFGGNPSTVRLGKMSPGGRNEDFSTLGPEGQCTVGSLQLFGPRTPDTKR
jgi:hypothetical protein